MYIYIYIDKSNIYSFSLSLSLSLSLSIYLLIYLSFYLSFYLSIYLYKYKINKYTYIYIYNIYIYIWVGLEMRCPFFPWKQPFWNQKRSPNFETHPYIYIYVYIYVYAYIYIYTKYCPSQVSPPRFEVAFDNACIFPASWERIWFCPRVFISGVTRDFRKTLGLNILFECYKNK